MISGFDCVLGLPIELRIILSVMQGEKRGKKVVGQLSYCIRNDGKLSH